MEAELQRTEQQVDTPINDTEGGNSDPAAISSRILKDAFHVMQMVKVSLKHGMAKEFSRRFRDALFVVDKHDKEKVEEYLVSVGSNWKILIGFSKEYVGTYLHLRSFILLFLLFLTNLVPPFVSKPVNLCSKKITGNRLDTSWKRFVWGTSPIW